MKVKIISAIIIPILLLGILAVSGYAEKPHPQYPELISVSGAIEGIGDPAHMGIEFMDTFGDDVGAQVSNPDGSLEVVGTRKGARTLKYYYCDASFHEHIDKCDNPEEHDPSSYKALVIYGGVLEGKAHDIQIIFPIGSKWEVRSKVLMDVEFSGTLLTNVVYKELN